MDLPGDYNDDGIVNAADYTVWRNTLHSTDIRADGSGSTAGVPDGVVDEFDYDYLESQLWADAGDGRREDSGGGEAAGIAKEAEEPSSVAAIVVAVVEWSAVTAPVCRRLSSGLRREQSWLGRTDLLLVLDSRPSTTDAGDDSRATESESSRDGFAEVDNFFAGLDERELVAGIAGF